MKKEDLLCISKGIGKMQGIRSISTNTLTNEFCKKMHASKNTLVCSMIIFSGYKVTAI